MAGSESSKEDKQLPATEQRLRKAAEEGNVARSRDAGHVLVLGGGLGVLILAGAGIRDDLTRLLRQAFVFDQEIRNNPLASLEILARPMLESALLLGGVLLAGALAAIAAATIPGGFNLSTQALGFKGERLNPLAGVKRIFSLRNLVEFIKLSVLAVVLGIAGAWFTLSTMPEFAALSVGSFTASVSSATALVVAGFGVLILILLAIALFDVPFQWFRHRADLRMTRDEMRREMRETDGDPYQKAQLKARQREISQNRMIAAVPSADIVVVNPTHYSVAIRYDEGQMGAPRVVAKGVDVLAARIQAIAREAGVPVLEAPPLARALYAHVELEQEVPGELYAAIAQVLAYVYQLRQWVPGRGRAPVAPVDLPVPANLDPHNKKAGPGAGRESQPGVGA